MKNLKIALKLEGPPSEKGLIRLSDLLGELSALQDALQSIDREQNGKSTLYYRVVSMSHRRYGKVVIEPVLKSSMKGPRLKNRWGHLPEKIHHAFFDTIRLIATDKVSQLNVGELVIEAIANLLSGLGKDFSGGEIANSKLKFQLDGDLKEKVDQLLKPDFQSKGSIEGQLLAINVSRGNRFYIYPKVGPRSVACQFPESLFQKAHASVRKNVRVYGTKYFRDTGFPFKIADVTSIDPLETDRPYVEFVPSPVRVMGLSADEAIKADREDSDEL